MDILKAIILGIVQGATEFLPVSSSGHLSVAQHVLGVSTETGVLFDLLLHIGTLAAVFFVFRNLIGRLICEFFRMIGDLFTGKFRWSKMSHDRRMVDPKVVELGVYNGIPHLLVPVVTDPRKAAGALNWAVGEMLDRYKKFAASGVRDLPSYNRLIAERRALQPDCGVKPLPQIVIIVDELADLMMAAPNEVEDAICRLAQMARAAGMHLVIATQRPSVDVITGVIKANIPSRIAFSVSSQVDSRTILDSGGAEKLLGRGDMAVRLRLRCIFCKL